MTFDVRVPILQLLDVLATERIELHVIVGSLYERSFRRSTRPFPLAHRTDVVSQLAVLHNSCISETQMELSGSRLARSRARIRRVPPSVTAMRGRLSAYVLIYSAAQCMN